MTAPLDRAASLLTGEPTSAGLDRYEREVVAAQARAPDYAALADEKAKALGLTPEQYVTHLRERGVREGWLHLPEGE